MNKYTASTNLQTKIATQVAIGTMPIAKAMAMQTKILSPAVMVALGTYSKIDLYRTQAEKIANAFASWSSSPGDRIASASLNAAGMPMVNYPPKRPLLRRPSAFNLSPEKRTAKANLVLVIEATDYRLVPLYLGVIDAYNTQHYDYGRQACSSLRMIFEFLFTQIKFTSVKKEKAASLLNSSELAEDFYDFWDSTNTVLHGVSQRDRFRINSLVEQGEYYLLLMLSNKSLSN